MDSKAHMGAGSITSNVKSDKKLITIKGPDCNIDTGIKRLVLFLEIMLRLAVAAYLKSWNNCWKRE